MNQMCHDQSLGLNIYDAAKMKKRYKLSTVKSDQVKYVCLEELMHTPMCKEKDAKVHFVVECFVHPKTKQRITKGDEDGYNSQVMLSLYSLHHHKAISKVTMSDTGLPKGEKTLSNHGGILFILFLCLRKPPVPEQPHTDA